MSKTNLALQEIKIDLNGSPCQKGGQIANQIFMPIVSAVSRSMSQKELAQFYVGALGSIFGMLLADFGAEKAVEIVTLTSAAFEREAANIEGTKTQ